MHPPVHEDACGKVEATVPRAGKYCVVADGQADPEHHKLLDIVCPCLFVEEKTSGPVQPASAAVQEGISHGRARLLNRKPCAFDSNAYNNNKIVMSYHDECIRRLICFLWHNTVRM